MALLVRRYSSAGQLDKTFGENGEARHDTGFLSGLRCKLSGSALVIAAIVSPRGIVTFLVRADGTLGGSTTSQFFPGDTTAVARAVALDVGAPLIAAPAGALQPAPTPALDAKVVSAGQARLNGVDVYGVARQRRDGSPDPGFSGDGRVRTLLDDMEGPATTVAVDRGRRVVVAGSVQLSAAVPEEVRVVRPVRYTAAGAVEDVLGDRIVPDGSKPATSITTSASGRDVFVGGAVRVAGTGRLHLSVMRFGADADGFGSGVEGLAAIAVAPVPSGIATDVTLDGRGRIVAVGQVGDAMGVFRFSRNGRSDRSFGGAGHVSVPFDVGGAEPAAVRVDARERIVVAGMAARELALLRLTDAGALDPTFGTGGKVFGVNGGDETRGAKQLVFRNDGKINVIGSSFVPVG